MSEQKVSLSAQPVTDAVPSEAVSIPSEGRFYPPGHPLHQSEFIEIRPMTARDEDILTSRALFKSGKVIDSLLRNCIVTKGIDISQMLVGDRNAAIIGIRVSGYGIDYSAKITCPACEEKSAVDVNLGQLPLKKVPTDVLPVSPFVNEFPFRLPISGRTVHFKLPTGADEHELSTIVERMRKMTGSESLVTSRLMIQVISVDGETDRNKISSIVRNMPARDSRELRAYMDYAAPDVKMVQSFSCPVCGFEAEEVDVPLGTEFFWPSTGR